MQSAQYVCLFHSPSPAAAKQSCLDAGCSSLCAIQTRALVTQLPNFSFRGQYLAAGDKAEAGLELRVDDVDNWQPGELLALVPPLNNASDALARQPRHKRVAAGIVIGI